MAKKAKKERVYVTCVDDEGDFSVTTFASLDDYDLIKGGLAHGVFDLHGVCWARKRAVSDLDDVLEREFFARHRTAVCGKLVDANF